MSRAFSAFKGRRKIPPMGRLRCRSFRRDVMPRIKVVRSARTGYITVTLSAQLLVLRIRTSRKHQLGERSFHLYRRLALAQKSLKNTANFNESRAWRLSQSEVPASPFTCSDPRWEAPSRDHDSVMQGHSATNLGFDTTFRTHPKRS